MQHARTTPLADGLWTVSDDLFMAGKAMHFPLRMTVVARPDGGLVLVSPVPIDDALALELSRLGPVRDILAPNAFHHMHAAAALDRYPEAQLHVSPALVDKLPALAARGRVCADEPEGWAPDLCARTIAGAPKLHEVVVLHRPSRTLIVTDLVFNMHRAKGWLTAPVMRLVGGYGKLAQSRVMRSLLKDRAAARRSYDGVLALDFDRLIMAHGDIVERDAHAQLTGALAWLAP